MIKGKTASPINVRTSPQVIGTNIKSTLLSGIIFIGSLITSPFDNKQWIELIDVDGVKVSGLFIASWVVTYSEYVQPENLGVPVQVKTIETFSDGSTRTLIWENPIQSV